MCGISLEVGRHTLKTNIGGETRGTSHYAVVKHLIQLSPTITWEEENVPNEFQNKGRGCKIRQCVGFY